MDPKGPKSCGGPKDRLSKGSASDNLSRVKDAAMRWVGRAGGGDASRLKWKQSESPQVEVSLGRPRSSRLASRRPRPSASAAGRGRCSPRRQDVTEPDPHYEIDRRVTAVTSNC
jgi:hypothetical protein